MGNAVVVLTRAFWCSCGALGSLDGFYYQHDSGCPCGSRMQHIHCERCGGLSQVG
jgi:hypothetical protein